MRDQNLKLKFLKRPFFKKIFKKSKVENHIFKERRKYLNFFLIIYKNKLKKLLNHNV